MTKHEITTETVCQAIGLYWNVAHDIQSAVVWSDISERLYGMSSLANWSRVDADDHELLDEVTLLMCIASDHSKACLRMEAA